MRLIHEIAAALGAPPSDVLKIIASAPRRYKVYEIDKRGQRGKRTIAQPAKEVKDIQRYVLDSYLTKFPVSDIATAYVKGKSIFDNAQAHAKNAYILKLDFRNFFPSITPRDFMLANRRLENSIIEKNEFEVYKRLLFWGQGTGLPVCLSIGAPTSPAVSNIVLYDLDLRIVSLANDLSLTVTRYADDITVSGPNPNLLKIFEKRFETLLKRTRSPKLELNSTKRGLYGRGERRMVTGLVITPQGNISLGRERKRAISALLHSIKIGAEDDPAKMLEAKGFLAFAYANERDFVDRLSGKYGGEFVRSLMRFEKPAGWHRAFE